MNQSHWQNYLKHVMLLVLAEKTFNLYSETPEDLVIVVKSNGAVQHVVNFEGKYEDLQIAFYRQRTLELLYKSTNGENQNHYLLKAEMKLVMNEINTYMKNNGMTENVQLKYLCNDIAIVYQTLGTRNAFMYSCSRQASNGDQRMHNVVVENNSRFTYHSDSDSDSDSDCGDDFDPSLSVLCRSQSHLPEPAPAAVPAATGRQASGLTPPSWQRCQSASPRCAAQSRRWMRRRT